MMAETFDRISAAGIDVRRVAETSVLVKIADVRADRLRRHPAWPLCRGLVAVGFGVEKWLELGKRGLTSMTEGRAECNHDNGKENERKEE